VSRSTAHVIFNLFVGVIFWLLYSGFLWLVNRQKPSIWILLAVLVLAALASVVEMVWDRFSALEKRLDALEREKR